MTPVLLLLAIAHGGREPFGNALAALDTRAGRDLLFRLYEDAEVVNPEERWVFFTSVSDVSFDMHCLKGRFKKLEGLPRIADVRRLLPSEEMCWSAYQANCLCSTCLRQAYFDPQDRPKVAATLAYLEYARQAWHHAAVGLSPDCDITTRRTHLRELREQLGTADFYAGRLPAPYPTWAERFMR